MFNFTLNTINIKNTHKIGTKHAKFNTIYKERCLESWKSLRLWKRPKESFPQLTNTDSPVVSTRLFTHTPETSKISAWNLAWSRGTYCRLPRTQSPVLFQQVSPFSSCSRTRASSNRAQTVRGTHVALENWKHSFTDSSDITWHSPPSSELRRVRVLVKHLDVDTYNYL